MTWRLGRTKQCKGCPWKVTTDPHDIPGGYSVAKHKALARTIAKPGAIDLSQGLRSMACHESAPGREVHCVGWIANQIGPGNNIALRLHLRDCENASEIELDGVQHECFQDTLPKKAQKIKGSGSKRELCIVCLRHLQPRKCRLYARHCSNTCREIGRSVVNACPHEMG